MERRWIKILLVKRKEDEKNTVQGIYRGIVVATSRKRNVRRGRHHPHCRQWRVSLLCRVLCPGAVDVGATYLTISPRVNPSRVVGVDQAHGLSVLVSSCSCDRDADIARCAARNAERAFVSEQAVNSGGRAWDQTGTALLCRPR